MQTHMHVYSIHSPTPSILARQANAGDRLLVCDYFGCVVPTADNYDPRATVYDFSCTYPTLGCTDSTQLLYNPLAARDTSPSSCVAPRLASS